VASEEKGLVNYGVTYSQSKYEEQIIHDFQFFAPYVALLNDRKTPTVANTTTGVNTKE
jgi:hypothetical protein